MEFDKYGNKTRPEAIAIFLQELLLLGVVAMVATFAIGITVEGPDSKSQLISQSKRTGSLLDRDKGPVKGQEAH